MISSRKIHEFVGVLLTTTLLLTTLTSCFLASSVISSKYRQAGDYFDSTTTLKDNVITIGKKDSGKQLESYSLQFNSPEGKDISIAYRSHIQELGWFQWSPSGQVVTSEQKTGIETIQIMLFGKDAFMYDVSYRIAIVGRSGLAGLGQQRYYGRNPRPKSSY